MKDLKFFSLRIALALGMYGLFKLDATITANESPYWSVLTFFLVSALLSAYERFFEIKGRDEALMKTKHRANRGA